MHFNLLIILPEFNQLSWHFLCLISSTHCYRKKMKKKNHPVSSLLLWRKTDKNTFIPNTKYLTPIHGVLAHPCFVSGMWQWISPVQSTYTSVAYLRNSLLLQMSEICCLHVFHKKSVIKLSDNSVSWANSGFTDLHQKRTCSQLLLTLSSSRAVAVNRHVFRWQNGMVYWKSWRRLYGFGLLVWLVMDNWQPFH